MVRYYLIWGMIKILIFDYYGYDSYSSPYYHWAPITYFGVD